MAKIDVLPGLILQISDLSDWSVNDVLTNDYGARETDNGLVIQFESEDELKQCVFKITSMMKKRHNPVILSSTTGDVLNQVEIEQSKFEDFTTKARSIRDNNCDSSDFESFVNVLGTKMCRKLYDLQLLSAYHLSFAQNACNFSVPGAGKLA